MGDRRVQSLSPSPSPVGRGVTTPALPEKGGRYLFSARNQWVGIRIGFAKDYQPDNKLIYFVSLQDFKWIASYGVLRYKVN